jgi:hypothetical protein
MVEDGARAPSSTAALEYASLGWPVFPIAPRAKKPLTEHGFHDATLDTDVIAGWWVRWPDANVGIATGPPGPTVIDCDGPVGKRNWSKIIAGTGWRDTPWSSTGGGGWHVWYLGDATVSRRIGWLAKVDLLGVGGYTIAPPSIHESGVAYEWCAGPDERTLQPLPAAATLLRECEPVGGAESAPTLRVARTIGSKYAATAFDGEVAKVRVAPEGQRNQTLVGAAFSLGQLVATGTLDPNDVAGALLTAAVAAGLPTTESLRTIQSGMRAGIDKPRRR